MPDYTSRASTLVKHNKNKLSDYMTTKPVSPVGRDLGIAITELRFFHVTALTGPGLPRDLISLQSKMIHQLIDMTCSI